ncbi:MAG: ATPase, partial [Pseudomonadota bacterium]
GAQASLQTMSGAELFAVKLLTEVTGSAALAFAIAADDLPPGEAFAASRLDETYQQEKWGIDEEAAARAAALKRDFDDVVRFLTLTRA